VSNLENFEKSARRTAFAAELCASGRLALVEDADLRLGLELRA